MAKCPMHYNVAYGMEIHFKVKIELSDKICFIYRSIHNYVDSSRVYAMTTARRRFTGTGTQCAMTRARQAPPLRHRPDLARTRTSPAQLLAPILMNYFHVTIFTLRIKNN